MNPSPQMIRDNPVQFFEWQFPWFKQMAGKQNLKEIHFDELNKNEEHEAYFFNEKSQVIKTIFANKRKRGLGWQNKTNLREYDYTARGYLVESRLYRHGKEVYAQTKYTYFKPGHLSSEQTWRKTKIRSEKQFTYNSDSTLQRTEYFSYRRGKKKSNSFYVYTYNADKKIKTTQLFRKNKLKHTWHYACNERGELVKKDTTSVCTSEGMDRKGRKIVTRHTTGKKGAETKTVYYYKTANGEDMLNEMEVYVLKKNKEWLQYKIHHPDSSEPYYAFQHYRKNGSLSYENRSDYFLYTASEKLLKRKINHTYSRQQEIRTGRTETYHQTGLPDGSSITGRKNKEYGRTVYTFNNPGEFTISHYRKNKLKKVYKASYTYY
jgi:hypothetical protein